MGIEVGTIKLPVRSIHKLSDLAVRTQKVRGRYSDGGGLYLNVGPSGGKSWVFMWTPPGAKRREMGLGSYPAAGLAAARTLAQGCREAVAQGRDPLQERRAVKGAEKPKTFAEAAEAFIATATPGWRNSKHAAQWTMTLGDAYCSRIRGKPVAVIDKEDVLAILAPIWTTKSATASRLRARIERVLNFARTKGWRPAGENPATWRGNLENTLPRKIKLQRGHHAAMPYKEVGALVTKLRGLEAMAARALEFTILCASRSGETTGARWSEFDLEKAIWTIPANRMKAGQTHIVPLSRQAVTLLDATPCGEDRGFCVSRPEAQTTTLQHGHDDGFCGRLKFADITVHGFRSAFRDFAGDETSFAREVAEQALAHKVGDATERAYRRASALEKRRELMQLWADYLDKKPRGKVVHLEEARIRA